MYYPSRLVAVVLIVLGLAGLLHTSWMFTYLVAGTEVSVSRCDGPDRWGQDPPPDDLCLVNGDWMRTHGHRPRTGIEHHTAVIRTDHEHSLYKDYSRAYIPTWFDFILFGASASAVLGGLAWLGLSVRRRRLEPADAS